MTTEQLSPRRVLALSVSALVVLAAEPLYLLVDTAIVGHLGATPLGGLAVGATLMGSVSLIDSFVEYGTTSRAARWHGAGQYESALNEGVQASWLAAVIGLVVLAFGEATARPFARLLAGGTNDVSAAAESWLRIALLGMPAVLLAFAGIGWMRGVQLTGEPVRIVLVANALSAALSWILVYPVGLGLQGSAWANVVGQTIAATLFLRALTTRTDARRPQRDLLRAQLKVGRDLVLRQAAFTVSFLAAAGAAARMGTAQVAAHQIGLQLWQFTALILDSFAIAAQSLVGAALGGSDAATARRVARQVAGYGLAAGIVFSALFAAGWWVIPQAFTSSPDVLHQAHVLWPWLVAMVPAGGLVFALDGVLIGAGDVAFMRTLTLVAALGAFVPMSLAALHFGWGLGGIWAGLAAFIAVRLLGMLLRARGERWVVLGAG